MSQTLCINGRCNYEFKKSLFYWDGYKNINEEHDLKYLIPENHIAAGYRKFYMKDDHHYSAFTLSELIDFLPVMNGHYPQLVSGISFGENKKKWCWRYGYDDGQNRDFVDASPVESCAKMLIYLIEHGFIRYG